MGLLPCARNAAVASCTIPWLSLVRPAGRSPTSLMSVETDPSRVERAKFSVSTAWLTIARKRFSSRRTRAFHHYSLGGELTVEQVETLSEEVEDVSCRWCGNGAAVEELQEELRQSEV